jgi:response regulator of citrate/malate metabolism
MLGHMGLHVLIIDDDTAFGRLLEKRLKVLAPELTVSTFENLAQAREYLRQPQRPDLDLVILDQHLPDGRGVDLLNEGWFEGLAVLSVSSDTSPDIPGTLMQAGATFFLDKGAISEPLFKPLVLGLIDRNRLKREVEKSKADQARAETVRTLVATLRHEINNPLGAVLGAAYLLQSASAATEEQRQAAQLVEASGKRIKHVLDQLCQAVSVESVQKADQTVFQIPGDKPWEQKK